VIEDEPEMRRNLTTVLRHEKFHPLSAKNGREFCSAKFLLFRNQSRSKCKKQCHH
jgi:DNA-binding response OmpR family regulator